MIDKFLMKFVNKYIPNDGQGDMLPYSEIILLTIVISSILASIFFYFVMENSDAALFIGLWAPTILGVINFINLKFQD